MPEPLDAALTEVRALLLDPALTRAVAAGRRRGQRPSVVRAELRPVTLKAGPRLQIATSDGARPYTRNVAPGAEADAAVDELLAEPFGNWHVETADGDAPAPGHQVRRGAGAPGGGQSARRPTPAGHDRAKEYLLDPGDPIFAEIGGSAAKRRQVDAFLRALAATLPDDLTGPLRVVDLGCGNAYLTFAAYRYLPSEGWTWNWSAWTYARTSGGATPSWPSGWAGPTGSVFVAGTIADAVVDPAPDLVLALHACDTATDEALARAVRWEARWVLAAPCCHHDLAAQLRAQPAPAPYELLTRQGILRERFADVLTDALRAGLLRLHGYRAEVVEFVDSQHTPRNLLIRARRTGGEPTDRQRAEYRELVDQWQVPPRLANCSATRRKPRPVS